MYIVLNQTNYDDGVYIGGVYKSYEKARKRCEWLASKHPSMHETDELADAQNFWSVVESTARNITDLKVD